MMTRLEFAQKHGLRLDAKLVPVAWPITGTGPDGSGLRIAMPFTVGGGSIRTHYAIIDPPVKIAKADTHITVFRGEVVGTICA